jgi:hypothetical protein
MKLNGIHRLLDHNDDVNLSDKNMHNTKKNMKDLFTAIKAGGLKRLSKSLCHVNRIKDKVETER